MVLADFLAKLVDAFGNTPYGKLELTWHEHLARWSAQISYWGVRERSREDPKDWRPAKQDDEGMFGRTPEEAVRKFLDGLMGKELYRGGPNGSWGVYVVKERVTCGEIAFTSQKETPPLREGHNEVLKARALELARNADQVYLQTFLGRRPLKGYPEGEMIDADREGKGFESLLRWIVAQKADCSIEVGVYGEGRTVGFRGGLS